MQDSPGIVNATTAAHQKATAELADVGGVGGVGQQHKQATLIWPVENSAGANYAAVGRELAAVNCNLYRNGSQGHGLIQILPNKTCRSILSSAQLAPVIADCLPMTVVKNGKVISELPAAHHLNNMLRTEVFLEKFRPVDHVTRTPLYDDDYNLVRPGYHDRGDGHRLLYLGRLPQIVLSQNTIMQFLKVMDFASDADRTNTVAAALTVLLRHHWLGQKPIVTITASKSHAGKGTTAMFLQGLTRKADVLYENVDWPMQYQLHRQFRYDPEIGVVCLDNVRLDSSGGGSCIRSAFIESLITSSEFTLAAPAAGEPICRRNHFVVVLNSNDGVLSPDLLNRSLPIHLAPKGDVHLRQSPIGDPKLEFLPMNQERIDGELRGMIENWREAGCPVDETVKHPMRLWARTIGGILQINGYRDFLANYGNNRIAEDTTRESLAILAGARPGEPLRPKEWAELAVHQGVAKVLFRNHERDTEAGRERAIGVVFSKHLDEIFSAPTETMIRQVRLTGGYRRWSKGSKPENRYCFVVLQESPRPIDSDENATSGSAAASFAGKE